MTRYPRYYRKHRERILQRYDDETPEHRAHRLALHRKHNRDYMRRKRMIMKTMSKEERTKFLQGKDISRHTKEYYREYRKKNREKILAQEKARRANRTPEQKEARAAYKKAYRIANTPNYGIGRGHYPRKNSVSHMSPTELAAHKAAQQAKWYEANKEAQCAYNREYYAKHKAKSRKSNPRKPRVLLTEAQKKERKRNQYLKYRDTHYQHCLLRERAAHEKSRRKTRKKPYQPQPSRRIPYYVTCPAEARYLALQAAERRAAATVPFATAIQSGLTVGRFSA